MDDLYNKKGQYERMIKILNNNYLKLNECYYILNKCRNNIKESFLIDDKYYSKDEFEKIINDIEKNKNNIKNEVLPKARYEYNEILYQISKM